MFERLFSEPTSVDSSQGDVIGQVVDLSGKALVERMGEASYQLSVGDKLYQDDKLMTETDSSVHIEFADLSKLSVEENATLVLDELVYSRDSDDLNMDINFEVGTFLFSSGIDHSSEGHDVSIETPIATIGIRGTALVCNSDSVLTCTVLSDTIEIMNDFGTYVADSDGETVETRPGSAPEFVKMLDMQSVVELFKIEHDSTLNLVDDIVKESPVFSDYKRGDNKKKLSDMESALLKPEQFMDDLMNKGKLDQANKMIDKMMQHYKLSPNHEMAVKINKMLDVVYHRTSKKDTLETKDVYKFSHTNDDMIRLNSDEVFNGNPYTQQVVEFHDLNNHQAYLHLGDGNSQYDVYTYGNKGQGGPDVFRLEFKGIERLVHYSSADRTTVQDLSSDSQFQALDSPAFVNHLYGPYALSNKSQTYYDIGSSGNDTMHDIYNNVFLNHTIDPLPGNISSQFAIIWGLGGNDNIKTHSTNGFSDYVYAGSGNDTVITYAGDDFIYGYSGNDTIYAGAGDDIAYAGSGNNLIYGMDGDDFIYDGLGDDTMYGDDYSSSYITGNRYINANDGDDYFVFTGDYGMSSVNGDLVYGNGGVDRILFKDVENFEAYFDPNDFYGPYLYYHESGKHTDTQYVNVGFKSFGVIIQDTEYIGLSSGSISKYLDVSHPVIDYESVASSNTFYYMISGDSSNNTLSLSDSTAILSNLSYSHTIASNETIKSIIMAHDGDDTIIGSHGDDWIDAGLGNDSITTGNGVDTLIVSKTNSLDTVTDFGSSDKLDLTERDLLSSYSSSNYIEMSSNSATVTSDHQVIWYTNTTSSGLEAMNAILTSDGTNDESLASQGLLLATDGTNADGYYWEGSANEGESYSGTLTQVLTLNGISGLDDLSSGNFV